MGKTNRKNDGKGLAGHNLRSEVALAAWNRKAGPMQDRRRERGGARNIKRDLLSQDD